MMSRAVIIFLGVLLSGSFVSAEPMAVYEIASDDGVYLEVDLDREIYRYSQDARLRDLMVLDAQGRELPSRIVTLQGELAETREAFPLSFFPVMKGEDPSAWLSRSGTELRIDKEAVSVRLDPGRDTAQSATVDYYIVDISKLEQALDVLDVNWLVEELTTVVSVEVSASQDLQQWRRLAQKTLAQLSKEGESLLHNSVTLSLKPEQYRFLRLRFLSDVPASVQALQGQRVTQHRAGPPPQRWEVSGSFAEDQRSQGAGSNQRPSILAWEFQRNERAPLNHFGIALDDVSYGERVQVFSRDNPRQSWRLRHSGIWFNVKVGDDWQQSEPVALRSNTDLFWRLELDKSARTLAQPRLVFEFPQQRLQFVANNYPPYRVAIASQVPTQRAATQILGQVVNDSEVSWQEVDKQLLSSAQPVDVSIGFNWQVVLFWSVLGLAVVILAIFALRLVRQMANTG